MYIRRLLLLDAARLASLAIPTACVSRGLDTRTPPRAKWRALCECRRTILYRSCAAHDVSRPSAHAPLDTTNDDGMYGGGRSGTGGNTISGSEPGHAAHAHALSRPTGAASSSAAPPAEAAAPSIAVTYTPGSGTGAGLTIPTTVLTHHCNALSEHLSKIDELAMQKKAQDALEGSVQVFTQENMDELMKEIEQEIMGEADALARVMRDTVVAHRAGMHELRRTLYYTTALHDRGWLLPAMYTAVMRTLTTELLRRDSEGVLGPDDILYVSTHMVAANFYNRHLWNRMERAMMVTNNFNSIELPTIKALTTKLFKTRRGCPREALDVRRKILSAMMRRVGMLANDFDLPSLLGILQCYSTHDMSPVLLEPLAVRATNHVGEFTPQECATLALILRRFRLMRIEVCERLVQRICTADQLNHHMAQSAFTAIRSCFHKVSDSGRDALHSDSMRQKLRAMGEQVGCRLEEVQFPALRAILSVLDTIVNLKIYIPKKSLQTMFATADAMIQVVVEHRDELVDPATGKQIRPVTMEEGRQLQALLLHYGTELAPDLAGRLASALRDGVLPDEASL